MKHFIGNFTGDSQAKVPWKDLSLDESHKLISKNSFPEDMCLLDPSKLQRSDVEALWKHWTCRQKANAWPLIFYGSAAAKICHAKACPRQPKKAPHPSPQHVSEEKDNGDNEDKDEHEDEDEDNDKDNDKDNDDDEADDNMSETPPTQKAQQQMPLLPAPRSSSCIPYLQIWCILNLWIVCPLGRK
jgi:hypothetical protein